MTIDELCQKALSYILSVRPKNYESTYTPSGYLKPYGSVLKYYDAPIKWNPGGRTEYGTFRQYLYTSETIPTKYTTAIYSTTMTSHWNSFKSTYINTIFVDTDKPISLSSFLVFLYLFRCFVDARFKLFTDSYNLTYVWLYDTTASVDYHVNRSILPLNITIDELSVDNIKTYLNAIIDEIVARDTIDILNSVLTGGVI